MYVCSMYEHAYTLYTTKAERHEGQKRKTARMVELISSVVLQPYVPEAAIVGARGCNRRYQRL